VSDSSVVGDQVICIGLYCRLGFDGLLNLACCRAGTGSIATTIGAREVLYIIVGAVSSATQIHIHIHHILSSSHNHSRLTSGPKGDANLTAHRSLQAHTPQATSIEAAGCQRPAILLPAATCAGSQPRAGSLGEAMSLSCSESQTRSWWTR
jgi:hypothetical protein